MEGQQRPRQNTPRGERSGRALDGSHRPGVVAPEPRDNRERGRSVSTHAGSSFVRVGSANGVEMIDDQGSQVGAPSPGPLGPLATSGPREVMSPSTPQDRPNGVAPNDDGEDDVLVRLRNFRVIQGNGFAVRQATDVVMTEESKIW